MKIIGMIPARGGSSRFNMKPLAPICGKPMLYTGYLVLVNGGPVFVQTDAKLAQHRKLVIAKSNFYGVA